MMRADAVVTRMREALVLARSTLSDLGDRMSADFDVGATAIVRCASLAVAAAVDLNLRTADARVPALAVANAYWSLEYLIDVGFDDNCAQWLHLRGYDRGLFEAALDTLRDALCDLEAIESAELEQEGAA